MNARLIRQAADDFVQAQVRAGQLAHVLVRKVERGELDGLFRPVRVEQLKRSARDCVEASFRAVFMCAEVTKEVEKATRNNPRGFLAPYSPTPESSFPMDED
jgi:hypothetical protein